MKMTSTGIVLAIYDQNWNLSTPKTIQYLPLYIYSVHPENLEQSHLCCLAPLVVRVGSVPSSAG